MDDRLWEWMTFCPTDIRILEKDLINSLLYAYRWADNYREKWKWVTKIYLYVHIYNAIFQKYNFKISNTKTKNDHHRGESYTKKVYLLYNVFVQVSHFNCLGCDISYTKHKDVEENLNFSYICGTTRRLLKIKTQWGRYSSFIRP